jgi:hypothetical protein
MIKKNGLKRLIGSALLSGFALSVGAAEPVAVLQQPQGKVFVGQSNAMAPARSGMAVYPGNRVVTAVESQVLVVFDNGCVLTLEASQLLAVRGPEQCGTGTGPVAGVRGVQGFASPGAIGQIPQEEEDEDDDRAWWQNERNQFLALAGIAGVAAIAAAININDSDSDDRPASPAR